MRWFSPSVLLWVIDVGLSVAATNTVPKCSAASESSNSTRRKNIPIYFLHIHKAGGTSMCVAAKDVYDGVDRPKKGGPSEQTMMKRPARKSRVSSGGELVPMPRKSVPHPQPATPPSSGNCNVPTSWWKDHRAYNGAGQQCGAYFGGPNGLVESKSPRHTFLSFWTLHHTLSLSNTRDF